MLTLDIVGPQANQLGAAARKVFKAVGGSIGRASDNDWVIPDAYISSHHARIHFRDGHYLLEDTSTNGVFIKLPSNRLAKGALHPLQSGDRIFIDAYEIKVTIAEAQVASGAASPLSDLFGSGAHLGMHSNSALPIPDDPFAMSDPFAAAATPRSANHARGASIPPVGDASPNETMAGEEFVGEPSTDPLILLGLGAKAKPAVAPKAADLARHSPLSDHFVPPATEPTTPLPQPSPATVDALIPDDYDPLSDFRSVEASPPPRPAPGGQRVAPTAAKPAVKVGAVTPPATPPSKPFIPEAAPSSKRTTAAPTLKPPPLDNAIAANPAPNVASAQSTRAPQFDLAALLAGAGVPEANLTPQLAADFGRILHIVVAGLMDVLRSRERIKDEFRMRMTTFKTADNNPLKFSANVEDALHNLLVKRNAAYLGPVEAFDDAFRDVRNHQMAMLAGMRVAFDAMLQSFEPEQLQEQFTKQLKRGALLAVPAKLRYWDLYRERFHDMVKDPEASFRELFGEEFAKAYEDQLERLKSVARNQKP